MTNIRHGLRVMQYSDVSQLDWHPGQILCNIPSSTSSSSQLQTHAVLIDFSAMTQTLDPDISLSNEDYGNCASELTDMDTKWVCEYWD